ncbi:hypothetical protein [Fluviicola taffensis]|uniref:hypothetical protein n=1 Tax=Fluviicola taffensis TaxID=191579 RepID=UPI0031382052
MKKSSYAISLIFLLQGVFISCNTGSNPKKELSKEEGSVRKTDSSFIEKKSVYDELLKKFKPISFDTLKVQYEYATKDKKFRGTELTLKEAMSLPLGITEKIFGKLSGVYGCYQFLIDSIHIGLIARVPDEYASTSITLFVFDRKTDEIQKENLPLSIVFGDAGDGYVRTSWLFKTKDKQIQSFVYDYSVYYHEVENPEDQTVDEWRDYYLFNCMLPKFDTISKNETLLKKRFKNVLKTEL